MYKGIKVYLLTEGGENVGFGHITRCIALDQAFEEKGIKPQIIINGDDSVAEIVKGKNYYLLNWLEKTDELFEKIEESKIVIIDSYLAGIDLYNKISKKVQLPVYIDDNKRLEYPNGIVINGAIHAETLDYPEKMGVIYLLGTKYQILRKEFWEVPEKVIREKIQSIMITFGGDDSRNITPKVLNMLVNNYPNMKKNVIIGRGFQNISDIEMVADKKTNLIYNADAKTMKNIMLESDIAISAGGQTLYELARVGIPTIAVAMVDNQTNNIVGWKRVGFLEYSGLWFEKNTIINIGNYLNSLEKMFIRKEMSNAGRSLYNGIGVLNIINSLV